MIGRIVLTGGPGAGKTQVSAKIAAAYADRVVVVPEAATQVYSLLRTRWDLLDTAQQRRAQKQIYALQCEQENRISQQHPDKILLMDRGTVDGATYWPDGPEAYWEELGTSLKSELARYDLVIWLQTAAAIGKYNIGPPNTCRFEDAAAAEVSGAQLAQLWGQHPAFYRVDARNNFQDKIAAVKAIIENVL